MDGLDEQYGTLAAILAAACPSGFERAWIDAHVAGDHVTARYWCTMDGAAMQPEVGSLQSFKIAKALVAIRTGWPDPPFDRATFTLTPDGAFKLDMGYPD